jgi:hypothetical protein
MSSGQTLPHVVGTMGWRLARPSWAGWLREKWKKEEGKERLAGPGSTSSWVSAHYQIGIRKIIFIFKSFYNLQTNLNSI